MEEENTNKSEYYSHMNLQELVKYCDAHSETPRALFSRNMVAQMIDYAGNPLGYPSAKKMNSADIKWYSLHKDMKDLVNLCKEKYNL